LNPPPIAAIRLLCSAQLKASPTPLMIVVWRDARDGNERATLGSCSGEGAHVAAMRRRA
jgi:hypothetical protein